MEKVSLEAQLRNDLGKGGSRHLRRKGLIPSVVYKDGEKGINVQVDSKALWHALHTGAGENAIITMNISGDKGKDQKTVILKEVQRNPVNDKFIHVDFHEISLKEKIEVKVPVVIKGEAAGVKEDEGVLNQLLWEIHVECLPTQIPKHIDINVEHMRIGDAVHVQDIAPMEGVEILDEPAQVVVSVSPPKKLEEEGKEEVVSEETEEPELIKKGKKEEEEEAGAEEPEK